MLAAQVPVHVCCVRPNRPLPSAEMQCGALVRVDQRNPTAVTVGQLLGVLNAFVQVSQVLLIIGKTVQRFDRCGSGGWGPLRVFRCA